MPVHGALLDGGDGAGQLVAGGDALDGLAAGGEHHVACLDDGDGVLALGQAQLLDGFHRDVGGDGGLAEIEGDDPVDGSVLDCRNGAFELVAGGDLHCGALLSGR